MLLLHSHLRGQHGIIIKFEQMPQDLHKTINAKPDNNLISFITIF